MTDSPDRRELVAGSRRIVVKVGSSSLASSDGGLDRAAVDQLVTVVAGAARRGHDVVLVSSGAIAAGIAPLGLTHRPTDLATQQAAASVGQGLLLAHYTARFADHGLTVGQVLLTVDDVTRRGHYRNAYRTLGKLLELGVVPVINENDTVATQEIRFGDNDRLAALVAHLVHADLLVLLSDVDALHTAPPGTPGAERITEVTGQQDVTDIIVTAEGSGVGTGGMVTKLEAARIATSAGIPTILTSAEQAGRALIGEPVGTFFHATGKRRPTRLLWLAHATEARGGLWLDDGAVRAVVNRKASLLAAGITKVTGEFSVGDPVNLRAPDGTVIARGLAGFDAAELPTLIGRRTSDLSAEFGPGYDRAVVHRDALVVL
ncbi:glutamate 5-kinase [Propionibacteriaceae bacterium Y2011]|uniref:glutamate 5-kinase n=1 Tax=Microlunatus sp. Y2014 TaxID=3418488 RepID=UPI003B446648